MCDKKLRVMSVMMKKKKMIIMIIITIMVMIGKAASDADYHTTIATTPEMRWSTTATRRRWATATATRKPRERQCRCRRRRQRRRHDIVASSSAGKDPARQPKRCWLKGASIVVTVLVCRDSATTSTSPVAAMSSQQLKLKIRNTGMRNNNIHRSELNRRLRTTTTR